jgi:RHH-type rel operon transcriptional repressor/antitoxin RelB
MAKTVSLRLDDRMAEELEHLARELERSKSYIIKSAIQRYLDEYAEYRIALDRLRDKDDGIVSSEEMEKLFGL